MQGAKQGRGVLYACSCLHLCVSGDPAVCCESADARFHENDGGVCESAASPACLSETVRCTQAVPRHFLLESTLSPFQRRFYATPSLPSSTPTTPGQELTSLPKRLLPSSKIKHLALPLAIENRAKCAIFSSVPSIFCALARSALNPRIFYHAND